MDSTLIEQLVRSIFRFKKVGMTFQPELDVSMGEIALMKRIDKNSSGVNKKINVSDIQSDLYITKPAISQMLNSLEKKGYISREIDTNDRRKILVALTPKGQDIVKSMREYFNNMLSEIIDRLGEDNTIQLIELFNRFADISEELKSKKGTNN